MSFYVGAEVKDNTVDTTYNRNPMVVGLVGGGFAIAWNVTDGAIYTRAFDADGTAIGTAESQAVADGGNQYEYLSGITALSGGGYQLAWTSLGGDGQYYGIRQQSVTSEGANTGSQSVVNYVTVSAQRDADLDGFASGGWISAYTAWGVDSSSSYSIAFRAFDASGNAVTLNGNSGDTRVSQSGLGGESDAHIAVLANGRFVVTWTTAAIYNDPRSGELNAVCQRVYNSDGTALTDELRVNVITANTQTASDVAALAGGGYVIAWQSDGGQDGSGSGVYQQVYNANGTALFDHDLQVNTSTTGDQQTPSIADLENGGWVVVWKSNHGGTNEIYQKVYGSDGTVLVDETLVNSTTGTQYETEVTGLQDGGWVVTWRAAGQDPDETNSIFHRRFGFTNEAPEGFDKTVTIKEDKAQALSANYFGFSDADDNALAGVIISSLPTKGTLKLSGVAVTAGQTIAAADLGDLTYTPPANASGAGLASFRFKVVDDGGSAYDSIDTDATANKVTFNVTEVIDIFTGTATNNNLTGTQGTDKLQGLAGNDKLKGLAGVDTFLFSTGHDKDTILDFDAIGADHDILNIANLRSVDSFADLKANHMKQVGANVVIDGLGGDMITLTGIKLTQLDSSDFVI